MVVKGEPITHKDIGNLGNYFTNRTRDVARILMVHNLNDDGTCGNPDSNWQKQRDEFKKNNSDLAD